MKNSKHIVFGIVSYLICFQAIHAQSTPVASGGDAIGAGGTSNFSIGQVIYLTAVGAGGTSYQGVQIPYEITTLGSDNFPEISLKMIVYPNPTTSILNLKIENYGFQELSYRLFDIRGKLIYNQKIIKSNTSISLESLYMGTYILEVTKQNKIIKSFKVIKNN